MEKKGKCIMEYIHFGKCASIFVILMRMNGNEKNGLETYLKQPKQNNGHKTYIAYKSGEKGYEIIVKLRNILKVEDLVADLLQRWVEENKEALEKIGIEF